MLRHAKTRRDPPSGGDDHERVLTSRGEDDAGALGRRLGDPSDRLGMEVPLPQLVLCSTAARATATASLALSGLVDSPVLSQVAALYRATPQVVVDLLTKLDQSLQSVMVVGHNPCIERLAASLPADPPLEVLNGLGTCGLVVVGFGGPGWRSVGFGRAEALGVVAPPF